MGTKITLQEYEEIEKAREKEIKERLKLAYKLLANISIISKDKFLFLKHEACISDLKSIPNILEELKRLRRHIKCL